MAKNKIVPITLMIIGVALLIGVVFFALDRATSPGSDGLGTWIFTVLGLLLAASTGIKGWRDLSKRESPPVETKIVSSSPDAQINTGTGGRNIKTETYFEHVEKVIVQMEEPTKLGLFTIYPPAKDFTGRTDDLEKLKTIFSHGATITGISGGGGIGKTELARKFAYVLSRYFPDARMEIDLIGTSESPLKTEDAMRRLLEPFYTGQKLPDKLSQLKGLNQQTYSSHTALLLLDNAADLAQVKLLFPPAPSAAIVTSRQHFTISEFSFHPLRLDVLSPDQARMLIRAAAPKTEKDSDDDIDRLAKLCGFLPLALRVAASLLEDRDDWTLVTLLNKLADVRTRLQQLKRLDDLDVEATISLSYDLLPSDLQKSFRYLSIFNSPFTSSYAGAIWGMSNEEDPDSLIGKLVNRSLLNYLPVKEGSKGVYKLHDLTRLFAIQRLFEKQDEAKEVVYRHAGYFLELAAKAEEKYEKGSENVLVALNEFRLIWPHLFYAYENFVPKQTRDRSPVSVDRWLCDLPVKCSILLGLYVSPREQILILEHALAAARRLKSYEGAILNNLGSAYRELGDTHKALKLFRQSLGAAREVGIRDSEGVALGNLGLTYSEAGDQREALEILEQALAIHRETGNRRGEFLVLGYLGIAFGNLGDTYKAIKLFEESLAIARAIGDRHGEMNAVGNLGKAYRGTGEQQKAINFYTQQLLISKEIGVHQGELNALLYLGLCHKILGDEHKAIEYYEQVLTIAHEIGDRAKVCSTLIHLGNAYHGLGDSPKAIEYQEQGLSVARESGDRSKESDALYMLGSIFFALGKTQKTIESYEEALAITREIGNRRREAELSWVLGWAYVSLRQFDKAISLMQVCVSYEREIDHPEAEKHAQQIEQLKRRLP